ncbi:MAG: di-heme-cytochrome C peroxidase [Pseudomonadota bacterium]
MWDNTEVRRFYNHLRSNGFVISVDQYVMATTALARLRNERHGSDGLDLMRATLGAIVCGSSEELERFGNLYLSWPGLRQAEEEESDRGSAETKPKPEPQGVVSRYWRIATAVMVLVLLLAGSVYAYTYYHDPKNYQKTGQNSTTNDRADKPGDTNGGGGSGGGNPGGGGGEDDTVPVPPKPDLKPAPGGPGTPKPDPRTPISFLDNPVGWIALHIGWWLIAALFLVLLLCLAAAALRARWKVAEPDDQTSDGEPPTLHDLRIDRPAEFEISAAVRRSVAKLHGYVHEEGAALNAAATISRSAEQAGFFSPVYGSIPRIIHYVILVDRRDLNDQHSRLYDEIIKRMRQQHIPLTVYDFNRDIRLCTPERGRRTETGIEVLHARHSTSHLIVFSDCEGLVDRYSGQPHPYAELIFRWPATIVLAPVPYSEWGAALWHVIEAGGLVFPCDTAGFQALAAYRSNETYAVNARDAGFGLYPDLLLAAEVTWTSGLPRSRPEVDLLFAQLRRYLGALGFRWLCACALYPALVWDLTLRHGEILEAWRPGLPESEKRFLNLLRLPWFREGRFPGWLRAHLIHALPAEDASRLRGELFGILDQVLKNQQDGTRLTVAVDDIISDLPAERREEIVNRLSSRGAADEMRDQVFVGFLKNRLPRLNQLLAPPKMTDELLREVDPDQVLRQQRRRTAGVAAAAVMVIGAAAYGAPLYFPKETDGLLHRVGDLTGVTLSAQQKCAAFAPDLQPPEDGSASAGPSAALLDAARDQCERAVELSPNDKEAARLLVLVEDWANPKILYADQGADWNERERAQFYVQDQGSRLMPLAWMRALRRRDGTGFLDDALGRYGYLRMEREAADLPLGFSVAAGRDGTPFIGLTCAACHTRQIEVDDKAYRIDGGPAIVDYESFLKDLDVATSTVLASDAAFDSFARLVLGSGVTDLSTRQLRGQVESWRSRYTTLVRASLGAADWGPGRQDAISMIFNSLAGLDIGEEPEDVIASNMRPANAPTRFPFLWNAARQDFSHWTGFSENGNDTLGFARNLGKLFGSFGQFHPGKFSPADLARDRNNSLLRVVMNRNFLDQNSANFKGLTALEDLVWKIGTPKWPFGQLDATLVERGEEIFRNTDKGGCRDCHGIRPGEPRPSTTNRPSTWATWRLNVGTDVQACRILRRTVETGIMDGARFLNDRIGPEGLAFEVLSMSVKGSILQNKLKELSDKLEGLSSANLEDLVSADPRVNYVSKLQKRILPSPEEGEPQSRCVYEARVLEGIWAAAPYLHNGSVPSLRALLTPARDRVRSFRVGPNYDIRNIGLAAEQNRFSYEFRATGCDDISSGNSNCGHEYGTTLSESDKDALLEYLKSL